MLRSEECDNMSPKAQRWQDVDKSEIPVQQLIRSFLLYQDQNHMPKTVDFYSEKLGRFASFLGTRPTAAKLTLDAVRPGARVDKRSADSSKL
jgi:hypothetical protein